MLLLVLVDAQVMPVEPLLVLVDVVLALVEQVVPYRCRPEVVLDQEGRQVFVVPLKVPMLHHLVVLIPFHRSIGHLGGAAGHP